MDRTDEVEVGEHVERDDEITSIETDKVRWILYTLLIIV